MIEQTQLDHGICPTMSLYFLDFTHSVVCGFHLECFTKHVLTLYALSVSFILSYYPVNQKPSTVVSAKDPLLCVPRPSHPYGSTSSSILTCPALSLSLNQTQLQVSLSSYQGNFPSSPPLGSLTRLYFPSCFVCKH